MNVERVEAIAALAASTGWRPAAIVVAGLRLAREATKEDAARAKRARRKRERTEPRAIACESNAI